MLSYFKMLDLGYDEAAGEIIVPTFQRRQHPVERNRTHDAVILPQRVHDLHRLSERRIFRDPEPVKYFRALEGVRHSLAEAVSYFKMLDLGYDEAAGEIIVPTFRQDLSCMADLAEEVARFYGYVLKKSPSPYIPNVSCIRSSGSSVSGNAFGR